MKMTTTEEQNACFIVKTIGFLNINDLRKVCKLDRKIKYFLFYMYITDIDLGGHGECVECNIGTYRFEKPSKNQLKFMKIITIGIPIQMDIGMPCIGMP